MPYAYYRINYSTVSRTYVRGVCYELLGGKLTHQGGRWPALTFTQ